MQINHVAIALMVALSLVGVYEQVQRSMDSEALHLQIAQMQKEQARSKEENLNRFQVLMNKVGDVLESTHNPIVVQQDGTACIAAAVEQPQPTFKEVGTTYGTDKVSTHSYYTLYDKYLPILRAQKKVKMLEIGLGCDMNYGPGHSLKTWHEYFKRNDRQIDFIEYDGKCIENYLANHTIDFTTVYVGSQSDRAFLQSVITKSGGMYDLIIDDGGHTMTQQRVSVEELLVAVRPGGFYVTEDLQTSHIPMYMDTKPLMADVVGHWAKSLANDLPYDPVLVSGEVDQAKAVYTSMISSVECAREMCVITKKN